MVLSVCSSVTTFSGVFTFFRVPKVCSTTPGVHFLDSSIQPLVPTAGLFNRKTKTKLKPKGENITSLLRAQVEPVLLTSQFKFGVHLSPKQYSNREFNTKNTKNIKNAKNRTDFINTSKLNLVATKSDSSRYNREISSATNLKTPLATLGRSLATFRTLSLLERF